jgi:hypothetical protein
LYCRRTLTIGGKYFSVNGSGKTRYNNKMKNEIPADLTVGISKLKSSEDCDVDRYRLSRFQTEIAGSKKQNACPEGASLT